MYQHTYSFKSIVILLFSAVVFLSACKKDVIKYDLGGKVYDPQLKTAVGDVSISLKAAKVESGVYNPTYLEISSTISSSNGNYEFTVEQESVSGYRLDFSKKNYFDNSVDVNPSDLQVNIPFKVDIDFIPIGNVKLNVKNTSPQGADDEIRFHFTNVDVKCKDCWNNDVIIGTGPSYSYSETKQLSGAKQIIISWTVTKNGNQHIYQDTIDSKAFDTVTFNINY